MKDIFNEGDNSFAELIAATTKVSLQLCSFILIVWLRFYINCVAKVLY